MTQSNQEQGKRDKTNVRNLRKGIMSGWQRAELDQRGASHEDRHPNKVEGDKHLPGTHPHDACHGMQCVELDHHTHRQKVRGADPLQTGFLPPSIIRRDDNREGGDDCRG